MRLGAAFHQSQHLTESQLLPPHTGCVFCGSKHRAALVLLQQDPEVTLLKCVDCGAASASRLPTKQALNDYYESYYRCPLLSDRATRITFDDAQRFGAHLSTRFFKYYGRALPSVIRILDFGGGDGTVGLETARRIISRSTASVAITVVDFDAALVSTTDQRVSLTYRKSLDHLQPDSYQLIIASAVIEHLAEPQGTMKHLMGLLSEGGLFYARTPYVVPLARAVHYLGLKWDFTFPAHIHDLGQDFWQSCFANDVRSGRFLVLESRPSIVETTLVQHPIRTAIAYLLKTPWYLFGGCYKLVGGWEVLVRKEVSGEASPSACPILPTPC